MLKAQFLDPSQGENPSVHVETGVQTDQYTLVETLEFQNTKRGSVFLRLTEDAVAPLSLGVNSIGQLPGRRVQVRDGAGAVVLWTVVPSIDAETYVEKIDLAPPQGAANPAAKGALKLKYVAKKGSSLFILAARKVDRNADYQLFVEDLPGVGTFTQAADLLRAKVVRNTRRGDPLPLSAASVLEFAGRRVEVRMGADVILEGTIPPQ